MAKKKTKNKRSKALRETLPDNALPQNIVHIGKHVEEDKNIYISQKVYKQIHKFTKNKTTNESGGMLIGSTIEEFGKTNIIISDFLEAKNSEATPTTLKFTHETWTYVHNEIKNKFPDKKIVGWIHTHPDFGIFLSENDKFIHQNFFNEQYQIAYVIDPVQNIEGFYFWINGKIERCKGFYVFDKTGVKITVEAEKETETVTKDKDLFSFKNIQIIVLSLAVVFLIFSNVSLNGKISKLERQQDMLFSSTNQALMYMQEQISSLSSGIPDINGTLDPQDPVDTAENNKGSEANES